MRQYMSDNSNSATNLNIKTNYRNSHASDNGMRNIFEKRKACCLIFPAFISVDSVFRNPSIRERGGIFYISIKVVSGSP